MTWVKVRAGQRINHGPGTQLEAGSVVQLDDAEARRLAARQIVEVVPAPKAAPKSKAKASR